MDKRSPSVMDIKAYKIAFDLSNYVGHLVIKWEYFSRYGSGSVQESLDWTLKSKHRRIVSEDDYNCIISELDQLPEEIISRIKYTEEKL
jgi:hypothetical protein